MQVAVKARGCEVAEGKILVLYTRWLGITVMLRFLLRIGQALYF